jgi:V/A-type H+/Na+-transporting ATPase subunit D
MYYRTMFDVLQLEQLIIPGINAQIRDIRSVLDQRALEEVTVLKRIKNKLEKREEEEAVAA